MLKDINGETIANSVDLNYIFNDIGVYHIALEAYSNDTLCESQSISKTISVFCPIQACIGDEVIDQYLHFEHCAENVDNFLWIIYSGENEVLYESTEPQDSYYINNVDYVRLCLTASSEFCEDDICEYITITNDGSEICNNGIDDDGDGLIDLFDPDCPCNETAYQAQCPTECEILPDEFPNIKMKLKWESEFFTSNTSFPKAYVDGDTVLIILDKYELTGYDPQFGTPLYNIEPGLLYGEDGMKKKNASNFHSSNSFSVFRNSASNMIVDISANRRSDNLYIDKIESNQITTSASLGDVYSKNRGSVADINGDGIVEIIFGTTIINSNNMAILAEGSAGSGCQGTAFTDCNYIHTVVADFLPSPGLELAAGNTVYGIELNNLDGKVGNVMTPIMCDGPAFDGVTSYGDFDLDGWLDVVSLREFSHPEGGGLFIWGPRTEKVMAKNDLFFSLSRGYAPHVNDLDHDCIPEIIIPFQDKIIIYKYNAPNLEIWYEISIEDSGNANVTTFDLNQDGYPEIIHRDEEFLRIIEGTTGITIDSTQLFSRTAREYPIIVDVDLDGQAEILISGYTTMEEESRLYCFESAVGPWAPARSVWNQYAYNPTMVNDDLTISRYPQNPAQPLQGTENCPRETCSTPYNNFMVQATYRTQEGCYVWPDDDCLEEICNNGIDDDGDGLIDLFDPDCPCQEDAYQAQCPPDCEVIPDSFPDIKMKLKWESNIAGIGNDVYTPYVFFWKDSLVISSRKRIIHDDGSQFGRAEDFSYFISGLTGETINYIDFFEDRNKFEAAYSINNFNHAIFSGRNSIGTSVLINYRDDDSFIVGIRQKPHYNNELSVCDLNGDGKIEIVDGINVYDAETLSFLGRGDSGTGCYGDIFNYCLRSHTVVADFIPEIPGLEIAAGNTVYNFEINNTSGESGNNITTVQSDEVFDGVTGMGDIDGDGLLDVIVVRSNSVDGDKGVTIWNPTKNELIAKAAGGERGSVPFIGDVDGDCIPEIGVVFVDELRMYKYNGTNELEVLYIVPTNDGSGSTCISMFDFNQDGNNKLVYRDETDLRILDGRTGDDITSFPIKSGTLYEFPVIADVDNDGQAEILVTGYVNDPDSARVFCFESAATTPWAPARSVWNQYAYNPTMVNDDLTISRYPQNPAQPLQGTENCPRETCSTPYNNFMVQATYRTQEGCYVWPELQRDLSVTASSRCVGDSLEICFYASSTDMTTVRNGVEISCYAPPWDNGSDSLIDVVTITQDTTCIMMPVMDGLDSMMIVINDDGGYYPPDFPNTDITECDYTNNEYVLDIRGPDLVVDILDYQCIGDSLIITLATDNIGAAAYANDPCIPVHLFYDTIYMDGEPLVFTTIACCFHWSDEGNMILDLIDTFNFTISLPMDVDQVCFSLNGGGIDFFLDDESDMMFAECDISNNYDCIDVDFEEKNLDLGPDMMKCETEVITLYAGPEFASYLWNDLTTDSIYSSSYEGLHYVEATDQCGRIYRDTVEIIYDPSGAIDLGEDRTICSLSEEMIEITGAYDSIFWYPSAVVDCDTCRLVALDITEETMLIVQGFNGDCVSTDSILLMMVVPEQDTIKEERCENDFIDFYDQQITTSGYYTHLTEDCQQLITLEAVFSSKDTAMITQSICMGDSYPFDGSQLTESGFYEKIELNAKGCDSLVMLQLSVVDEILASEVKTICEGDSIEIFGTWEKLADIYEASFESSAGCDSTHQVTLMVDERYQIEVSRSICQGDSTEVGGIWYKEKGVYPLALLTHGGCDSMVTVVIEENQSYNDIIDKEICVGGSYDFDGQSIVESGVYTADFTTSSGCDSVITLELSIVDNIRDSLRYELCEGDSMEVFGDWIMEDYSGTRSYESLAGCDSIVHVSVALLPVFTIIENYILCPDETLIIHGEEVVTGGSYDVTFTSILGCDSTYTITIEEISPPPLPVMKLDCEEESIIMSMPSTLEEAWSIRWSNALSEQSSVYEAIGGEEHVQLTQSGCEVVYKFDIPVLPDFGSLPTLPDTLTDQGSVLTFDLGLDVTIWEANWSTSLPQSCSSCMQNNITATDDEEVIIAVMHLETGCTYDVVFQIMVLGSDISVPNVFSPDAIGNQTWRPSLPDGYDIIEVYIYDRWGNQVAVLDEQNDYTWDGRYKNRDVMEGVYVYLLKATNLSGEMKIYKGDVTVMR